MQDSSLRGLVFSIQGICVRVCVCVCVCVCVYELTCVYLGQMLWISTMEIQAFFSY